MYDRMQLFQVRQTGVLVNQSPCCRTHLVSHAQWNTTSRPQSTRTGSSSISSSLCRAAVTNGQTRCERVLMANRGWCQDKQGSMGSYYCTREACPTNRNRCPIDSGDVSLWWCLRHLLPFPNLAHHRPRAYLLYTGKFSLSQSIAPALGRPFQCIFSDGVWWSRATWSQKCLCCIWSRTCRSSAP